MLSIGVHRIAQKLARYTANIPVNEKWNLVTGERKQIPQIVLKMCKCPVNPVEITQWLGKWSLTLSKAWVVPSQIKFGEKLPTLQVFFNCIYIFPCFFYFFMLKLQGISKITRD